MPAPGTSRDGQRSRPVRRPTQPGHTLKRNVGKRASCPAGISVGDGSRPSLLRDDLETGLTNQAVRTDAARVTSSHVLSTGMYSVVGEPDAERVANPIAVDHQASVLGGFCLNEQNGPVLELPRNSSKNKTHRRPSVQKQTSPFSSLTVAVVQTSTIDLPPWLGPRTNRCVPLLLTLKRAKATLWKPGCCGSLRTSMT